MKGLRIAYVCNVRPAETFQNHDYGEWESPDTIQAVTKAFEASGNKVMLLDADDMIMFRLAKNARHIDMVFNNAEGFKEAELREARVPFFCEELALPYSGSGPQTLINTMDKPTTKEILMNYGIPTPLFEVLESYTDRLEKDLRFPMMVKPVSEGTSIGISPKSRVTNQQELEDAVREVIRNYRQPALVEEFVDGTEYTVGIIGNRIMPILKVPFEKIPGKPQLRDPHIKDIETPFMEVMPVSEAGYEDLAQMTVVAFEALKCDDYCRMDYRKGRDGRFYFLEMNPLPGIHPVEADLTNMARHAGLTHTEMINWIMWEAIKRHRRNKEYAHVLTPTKVAGIRDMATRAQQRLQLYEEPVSPSQGSTYRKVRGDRAPLCTDYRKAGETGHGHSV